MTEAQPLPVWAVAEVGTRVIFARGPVPEGAEIPRALVLGARWARDVDGRRAPGDGVQFLLESEDGSVRWSAPETRDVELFEQARASLGPEDGHLWRFLVQSRGSYGLWDEAQQKVVGYTDAEDISGEPWTLEVRAWSLTQACLEAAVVPLGTWVRPNGKRLGDL
jgi:hypothetical protein